MTSVFLFISIVLNIIALFSIVILYLRQSRLFEVEKKQQRMIEEMEDVISTYLAEMKEENESFIDRITKVEMDKDNKQENRKQEEVVEPFPPIKDKEEISFPTKGTKSHAVRAYKKGASQPLANEDIEVLLPSLDTIESPITDHEDVLGHPEIGEPVQGTVPKEKTLLEEVLQLQKQGLSLEEIAKKLHKGKTEIELLLKFRQINQE